MTATALKEGFFTVDMAKKFTPLTSEAEIAAAIAQKATTVCVQPFLIKRGETYVLVDAGLGLIRSGEAQIIQLLAENGLSPDQVSIILLSHLHKDHTNGLGYFEGEVFVMNFPDAQIYLQDKELNFALSQDGNPSYNMPALKALAQHANVVRLQDAEGWINDFIRFEVVGGHTPNHQVFWFEQDDAVIFYGGDNLPMYGYLKYPVAYKNDYDGKKALSLRKEWETRAEEEHWEVLFYHDKRTAIKQF
ncbi:MBL fold metallo-hydrolase [Pedobacter rhizosphaerae]|uniref:Glyoxylase, beta-lactamase superfamily II n=1 Tax=Pedobacter rhizosphaerae TaxID=390241 RepID=A0A1H9P7F2_9SPHI|nr:MBL fold metallo-hydrolase [Pedobacter rhizosphaerae]SER44128.1 Glyoxylase, beta-lactamase superfamily II [Pedobacter rhizosphaerae]